MKREADGEMGAPQKRYRRGDEEVRLLIPSKIAGSIIGKGGQNITKLRSQYKASITVPDCPGPERMLTLSSDLETICNIVNDVIPNLEENNAKTYNGNELDLRMLIHQSQAGCIIGRAGKNIKEIREKTGAHIKIFTNTAPRSSDRIIQIVGDSTKCIETIREVLTLIKTSPIRGIINPYDPHNYDEFYAEEYGGWGSIGNSKKNGTSGFERNSFRDAPTNVSPVRLNNKITGSHVSGFDRSGSNTNHRHSFGGNRSIGNSYDRNVWDGFNQRNNYNQPPPIMDQELHTISKSGSGGKNSTQVTIPKDLAGAIIGKGGGRIRKIRHDSGAGITIDEPLPGSNDRIITISGLPTQIQMAQYLLQQSVHNNADRNIY